MIQSVVDVKNIMCVEGLRDKLGEYNEKICLYARNFHTDLTEAYEKLKAMESRFVAKVNAARASVNSCHASRAVNPQISCYNQEQALQRAEANLSRYKTIMSGVSKTHLFHEGNQILFLKNQEFLVSYSIPRLSHVIDDMRKYHDDNTRIR